MSLQSISTIDLIFNEPYNALYAWDNNGYSGVIDPAPSTEGSHVLHVKVEKEPGVFEIWNFSYTIDNTPINLLFNPDGVEIRVSPVTQ